MLSLRRLMVDVSLNTSCTKNYNIVKPRATNYARLKLLCFTRQKPGNILVSCPWAWSFFLFFLGRSPGPNPPLTVPWGPCLIKQPTVEGHWNKTGLHTHSNNFEIFTLPANFTYENAHRRRSRSTRPRHGWRPTITKLNSKCKNINLVLILELGSLHRPNWPSETHEHGRIYLWWVAKPIVICKALSQAYC